MSVKYYISGPMTGYQHFNVGQFQRCAEAMRDRGYNVLYPHELMNVEALDWHDALRRDLIAMLQQCNAIILLEGWQHSNGAKLELHVARTLNFTVFFWYEDEQELTIASPHELRQILFDVENNVISRKQAAPADLNQPNQHTRVCATCGRPHAMRN